MRLGRSVAGWQREPQPAAPAGRWAARTGYSRLPTSALQNACCGCTGEQLQASARRSSVASSRRPSASRRLRAAAPMARRGPVSGCCGAGWGAGHAPPHLARSPAQTFCPLCVGGKRRGEGAGQCTRRRRKRLGAASERSPARLLRCLLWLCLLRARAEPPFYCAPRILCSSSRWLAASAGRALPTALLPRRPALPRTPAFVVPSLARLWASRTTWHAAPQGHARCVPDCPLRPHPRSPGYPKGRLCGVFRLMGPDSGWNSGLVPQDHQAAPHPS